MRVSLVALMLIVLFIFLCACHFFVFSLLLALTYIQAHRRTMLCHPECCFRVVLVAFLLSSNFVITHPLTVSPRFVAEEIGRVILALAPSWRLFVEGCWIAHLAGYRTELPDDRAFPGEITALGKGFFVIAVNSFGHPVAGLDLPISKVGVVGAYGGQRDRGVRRDWCTCRVMHSGSV